MQEKMRQTKTKATLGVTLWEENNQKCWPVPLHAVRIQTSTAILLSSIAICSSSYHASQIRVLFGYPSFHWTGNSCCSAASAK